MQLQPSQTQKFSHFELQNLHAVDIFIFALASVKTAESELRYKAPLYNAA